MVPALLRIVNSPQPRHNRQTVIDLRSDTQTKPSAGMRAAMAAAEVGDEQRREDPTVLELEDRAARFLGQEDAVYLPTATMANQIALAILGVRGTELIVEETAHIMVAELAGAAMHSGLQTRGRPGYRGRLAPEQVRVTARTSDGFHIPSASIVALENTHNSAGGTVWPLDELAAVVKTARELDLAVHLDGARVANAAIALGVPAAEIAGRFDTVTLCLSKGLGCPLGAVIAGSHALMGRARVEKHRFGGAMRQAGIVAAAGVYALDHNVERLADDHARARRLAQGWEARGVAVELELVETNFVQVDVAGLGLSSADAIARLADAGVGLSATVKPGVLRAVTHLDIDDDDVERALELVPRALEALARA
jgi:threonine aldolase